MYTDDVAVSAELPKIGILNLRMFVVIRKVEMLYFCLIGTL